MSEGWLVLSHGLCTLIGVVFGAALWATVCWATERYMGGRKRR